MVTVRQFAGASGFMLAATLLFSTQPATHAQAPGVPAPTFTKDVLPILQRSCQTCHRPGTHAPMSLVTYRDARPWARSIKQKVTSREMPPVGAGNRTITVTRL